MSINISNDDDIVKLIQCEKVIIKKPPNPKESNRDIKRAFSVMATGESLEFEVFFAENTRLPEDFSIGLMLDKYLLLRCNGFHGTTLAGFHIHKHHAHVHSHTLTYNDIINGREDNPSNINDLSGKYFCFQSAQLYFLKICNVINYQNFFDYSKLDQISFDDL